MPSLCLAITTYNRSALLAKSLTRLAQLTLPDEIIIVDDGSNDGFENVYFEIDKLDLPIRYIYNHRPYQAMCSQARNVALKATQCELFMTSEPEMLFETDIVAQFLAKHAEVPNAMLNTSTVHHEHPDWNPPQTTTTTNWEATWVACFNRERLLEIGGWDEHFPDPWGWDDVDLVTRYCMAEGNIKMPECVATHQWHPSTQIDQGPNERYFQAKQAEGADEVANRGCEWGIVVPR